MFPSDSAESGTAIGRGALQKLTQNQKTNITMYEVDPPIQEEPTDLQIARKPLTFWKGVLYALVILGSQLIVGGIVGVVALASMGLEEDQIGSPEAMSTMMDWIMGIALPVSFLLAVAILLSRRKLHPDALKWNASYSQLLLIGLLMLFGFDYIVGELMTYLPNYEEMLADYKSMFEGINMTYLLIGGVLIGPICEEIIFRGIIQEGFIHTYGGRAALLYAALIFGVIHLLPLQVINAFLAGILLGWIYWRTRSLWLVMLLHIINNFVAFQYADLDTSSFREWFGSDVLYGLSFPMVGLLMYGGYRLFESIVTDRLS